MQDGRGYAIEITEPLGSERRPVDDAVLISKFRDCASRALIRPNARSIDAWVRQVLSLEECGDMRPLVRSLGGE
jgi:hypothetical protein